MSIFNIPAFAYSNTIRVAFLLVSLMTIDIITAWLVIVEKYNDTHNKPNSLYNIFRGVFFRAWEKGFLESKTFRTRTWHKAFGYLLSLLIAFLFYIFPPCVYNGIELYTTVPLFIHLFVTMIEVFSIAENIKKLGVKDFGIIKKIIKYKID